MKSTNSKWCNNNLLEMIWFTKQVKKIDKTYDFQKFKTIKLFWRDILNDIIKLNDVFEA